MRPAQNSKRMRGRPNSNRKGPNPLTRSYESSGPDVKIRGTAHHISEKYLQLARDAQASGDPVMAESYLQHAEHYLRLIAAAQQAQQQAAGGYQRLPGDGLMEENEDDADFVGIPDRFASPAERFYPPSPPGLPAQPQPNPAQPAIERSFQEGGERQAGERQILARPERPARPERAYQDRNYRDREYHQTQGEKPYQDRNGRGRDQDGRSNRGRAPRYRDEPPIRIDPKGEAQMEDAVIEGNGLPAFITSPVRVPTESHESSQPIEALSPLLSDSEATESANGFHPRPRRRRRNKVEMGADEARDTEAGSATEPVQE